MKKSIVLATANARYSHTAFGLRWLYANLGELRGQAVVREFTIRDSAERIAAAVLEHEPRVAGFGVYIWNFGLLTEAIELLKAARPDVAVVVGGPEASHEYEGTALFDTADYLVRGEGEVAFAQLAAGLLRCGGSLTPPTEKVVDGGAVDVAGLRTPYELYTEEDIARRVVYVESSRGCPFRCGFCLSSLDKGVREFPIEPFLIEMGRLVDRGARQFKFVDRTFNLRQERVTAVLNWFLERPLDGLRLHFEIVPDRLTAETFELFGRFPPGALHLEAGVQSFNPDALAAVSRRQDLEKTVSNLRFLREQTGALIHADLVAGLPGETWESFAGGFDRLVGLRPHALQVGILKRLKGTPLARYDGPHKLAFRAEPPYGITETDLIDAARIARIKRFARYFDVYYNSGNFPRTCCMIWEKSGAPFQSFMSFSDFLWEKTRKTHAVPLAESARLLYKFLTTAGGIDADTAAAAVEKDFRRLPGRRDRLRLNSAI